MSIVVHWYYTSSLNAFTGKYSLEMVKDVEAQAESGGERIYRARCRSVNCTLREKCKNNIFRFKYV